MEQRKCYPRQPMPPAASMDGLHQQLQQQQAINRGLPFAHLAPGTVLQCPTCSQLVEVRETKATFKGRRMKYLSDCACNLQVIAEREAFSRRAGSYQAGLETDVRHIRHLTFDTFDWRRYPTANNPASEARSWIDSALPFPVANYHAGPLACLYFYSPGKGRGKTHLASAIAHVAAAYPRSVQFINEMDWIGRYWAADMKQKADMAQMASERAWLTIIDDMGQRENPTAGLRNAWYDVFDARWLRCGWTIITSNWTPDELLARGTINDATHSRLTQMIGQTLFTFDSGDYRLESVRNDA